MKLKTDLRITRTALDIFLVCGDGNASRGVERAIKILDADPTGPEILRQIQARVDTGKPTRPRTIKRLPVKGEAEKNYREGIRCSNGHELTQAQYDKFEWDGCPRCGAQGAAPYREAET